jgi:hypothetical protein
MTEVAHNVGLLFPKYRLCINFDKNWIGLHFGRLKKPIWFISTKVGRMRLEKFQNVSFQF